MNRSTYETIEGYMLSCMKDATHDKEHIYRVLYAALDIAQTEPEVDRDILITAALLHDIGREAQFRDPSLCHAQVGSQQAYHFLLELGWPEDRAAWVRECILTHRYRTDQKPRTLEAKILFDADKLDVTGAIGIARTLLYGGQISQPLYSLGEDGKILTRPDSPPSFFREYNYKLRGVYTGFYTRRGERLAAARQAVADGYYDALLEEITTCQGQGQSLSKLLGE